MELTELQAKSEQLHNCRRVIDQEEEAHNQKMIPLKAERDRLQMELINGFTELNLSSIRVAGGDTFTKATRKSITIVDEYAALEWARGIGAVTVDTKAVAQMAKDGKELPAAFRPTETNYISVRKAKASADTTSN